MPSSRRPSRKSAKRPAARARAAAPPEAAALAVSSDGDILAQLRSLLPGLAPAEQRVGDVIVGDPARAAQLTITELAAEAQTSETTVIRFCRSIGIDGYPTLRLRIAAWGGRNEAREQPRISPQIVPEDDLQAVVARIGQSLSDTVRETAERIDLQALEAATIAISGARRIDIYGVGASALVAADLQTKLHRIGLSVWAWPDPHLAITSAANLQAGDVVVAISHTGQTTDTLDPLVQAKARGARTIAITNFTNSAIAEAADIVLTTVSDEAAFRSGAMGSRIAALVIVDCLFAGVAKQDWTKTVDALVRTNEALADRRRATRARR